MASGIFEHFADGSDEVLVTSFTTYGTPLIRYRIGDNIRFSDRTYCWCGIESTQAEKIEGRKLDFLYTSAGAKINAGNVANLFKNMPNALIKAQVIQDDLYKIKILLQVDQELYKPEYDKQLLDEIGHKFGPKTKVEIEHVDDIPCESSGKFRFIKNNVILK